MPQPSSAIANRLQSFRPWSRQETLRVLAANGARPRATHLGKFDEHDLMRQERPSVDRGALLLGKESRLFEPVLLQPIQQRVPRQAEEARGLAFVALGPIQRLANQLALYLVQVDAARRQAEGGCLI